MPGKGTNAGRATPKRQPSGRYTAPIPKAQRTSPRWYPWVIVSLLFIGLFIIVVNYSSLFWSASNWALIGGIGAILIGTIMATRYR
jgi:hypothetical protein